MNTFKNDFKKNKYVLAAVAIYLILSKLIFHSFCPLVIVTGFPCPGCGLTRAGLLVLTMDFAGAWQMNPAIYPWLILILYFFVTRYIRKTKKNLLLPIATAVCIFTIIIYIVRLPVMFPAEKPLIYNYNNLLYKYIGCYKDLIDSLFK